MSKVHLPKIAKLPSNIFKLQSNLILKMVNQICLDEPAFKQMEERLLSQITDISKAILETFKFKMIY